MAVSSPSVPELDDLARQLHPGLVVGTEHLAADSCLLNGGDGRVGV